MVVGSRSQRECQRYVARLQHLIDVAIHSNGVALREELRGETRGTLGDRHSSLVYGQPVCALKQTGLGTISSYISLQHHPEVSPTARLSSQRGLR